MEDTNSNTQPVNNTHVNILPNKKSRFNIPKPFVWILSCLGGCVVFSLFCLFILSFLITLLASSFASNITENIVQESVSKNKIAIVPIDGVIVDDQGSKNILDFSTSSSSSGKVIKLLDVALNDPDVKAVLVKENTPGGSTLAMRKICDKIKTVNSSKPVYTYIESEGASAGYYIANCTRYIIADKQAITGSIGALIEVTDIQGLLDKLGIKTKVITNTQGTQKQSDVFAQDSKDEKKLKVILDEAYDDFIRQVVEGRNNSHKQTKLSEDKIRTLATGEIFSGSQAKLNGLVDENGFLNDAIKTVVVRESLSSDIKVVEYRVNSGVLGGLSSSISNLFGIKSDLAVPLTYSTFYSIRQ